MIFATVFVAYVIWSGGFGGRAGRYFSDAAAERKAERMIQEVRRELAAKKSSGDGAQRVYTWRKR